MREPMLGVRVRDFAADPMLVTAAAGTVVAALLVGIAVGHWLHRRRPDRDPEVDLSQFIDTERLRETPREEPDVAAVTERHRDAIAPEAITWESRRARVGDRWVATLYVA